MTDKKALIEKLIQDKHISLDEGLLLLQTEKEYISAPYPVYPYYQSPWWGIYPPSTVPYLTLSNPGVLTVGTPNTWTVGDTIGGCAGTTVTSYPEGTVISYTAN